MVERVLPQDERWSAVDCFIEERLLGADTALSCALTHSVVGGLPDIAVAPVQGKLLHLLARMASAQRILEVGTLGGYSTIWLARALPRGGELVTLEVNPDHAVVARANIDRAGLAGCVEVVVGPALDSLASLSGSFDFIFIDADKENNLSYMEEAVRLSRSGTTIVVDNVVREGGLLDATSDDVRIVATRALFDKIAADPRLSATAIQTVGRKKWDGFLLAVVN